jgi:hypothetical protein
MFQKVSLYFLFQIKKVANIGLRVINNIEIIKMPLKNEHGKDRDHI